MRRRLFLALVLAATPAAAQRDFSSVEIKAETIAPGVAVLVGSGGNIAVSYGEDSTAIVDDQFAPLTDKIVAAIASLGADPVRFVINTHWHGDHTGGNENFGKAGAVIMAHDNVRVRLSTEQVRGERRTPPSPHLALPVVTYADGVTLHLNGDTLHLVHAANAHTDGDTLVHWQRADVLHMGDTFFNKASFPFIDLDSGGSIDGAIAAVDRGLKFAGPATKIIPGHGPMANRADLAAYRDMLVDIRARVAAAIAAGQTVEQVVKSAPAARYAAPAGRVKADGFITPAAFTEAVYKSLKTPPPKAGHSH